MEGIKTMNFGEMIKAKRKNLKETQEEFGKRFEVSHASVSDWEANKTEAPYKVINFILQDRTYRERCNQCGGTGYVTRELILNA